MTITVEWVVQFPDFDGAPGIVAKRQVKYLLVFQIRNIWDQERSGPRADPL